METEVTSSLHQTPHGQALVVGRNILQGIQIRLDKMAYQVVLRGEHNGRFVVINRVARDRCIQHVWVPLGLTTEVVEVFDNFNGCLQENLLLAYYPTDKKSRLALSQEKTTLIMAQEKLESRSWVREQVFNGIETRLSMPALAVEAIADVMRPLIRRVARPVLARPVLRLVSVPSCRPA